MGKLDTYWLASRGSVRVAKAPSVGEVGVNAVAAEVEDQGKGVRNTKGKKGKARHSTDVENAKENEPERGKPEGGDEQAAIAIREGRRNKDGSALGDKRKKTKKDKKEKHEYSS